MKKSMNTYITAIIDLYELTKNLRKYADVYVVNLIKAERFFNFKDDDEGTEDMFIFLNPYINNYCTIHADRSSNVTNTHTKLQILWQLPVSNGRQDNVDEDEFEITYAETEEDFNNIFIQSISQEEDRNHYDKMIKEGIYVKITKEYVTDLLIDLLIKTYIE